MANNYLSNTLRYLLNILVDAREWQYTNINGDKSKPKRISLPTLIATPIILAYLFYKKDTVIMSDNFISYMLTAFSIFVGIFITILIMAFDKFTNLYDIYKKTADDGEEFEFNSSNDRVKYLQSRNFFFQFTHITLYNTFLAIFLVILLILPLLFQGLSHKLTFYFPLNSLDDLHKLPRVIILKGCLSILHKFLFLLLTVKSLILTTYSLSSIFTYMKITFERKNP